MIIITIYQQEDYWKYPFPIIYQRPPSRPIYKMNVVVKETLTVIGIVEFLTVKASKFNSLVALRRGSDVKSRLFFIHSTTESLKVELKVAF